MNPSQGFILTGIFFAFRVCAPMLSDTPGYHLTFCKHKFLIDLLSEVSGGIYYFTISFPAACQPLKPESSSITL